MRLYIKTIWRGKILLLVFLLIAGNSFGQSNNIIVKGDTLILDNGTKFWIGEEVTVGTGMSADKSYLFIYESPSSLKNIIVNLNKRKPMTALYAGHTGMVKKFEKQHGHKNDYGYSIIVLQFIDGKQYWCDVQNASTNNEILSGQPNNTLTNTTQNVKDSVKNNLTTPKKKTTKKPVTAF